ncbi:MAG: hypothetical protein ACM336_11540, partial [Acidobacteriota bacterium]
TLGSDRSADSGAGMTGRPTSRPVLQHSGAKALNPGSARAEFYAAEMRRLEVHLKGKETMQQAGLSFPDGITTTHLELGIDFSAGKPVGWYKTAEMEQPEEHPVEQRWVWKTEGDPDVMELCSKGLEVVRQLVKSRDQMGFPD